MDAHAREIAEQVLRHPLVSGSILMTNDQNVWAKLMRRLAGSRWGGPLYKRWTLAKAIRVEELVPVMRNLAQQPGNEPWRVELFGCLAKGAAFVGPIGAWFDGAMDRVSERFATRTRIVAVVASFVLAMTLHVDAVHVLSAVSTDEGLRTRLLEVAGPMAKRDVAMEDAVRLRAALAAGLAEQKISATPPTRIVSVAEAEAWLAATVPDPAARAQVSEGLARAIAQSRVDAVQSEVNALTSSPIWGALDLWPIQARHAWTDIFWGRGALAHLLGTLFGGALLSFGAPFWFNLLKSLMNLRPPLAAKADRERAARP